jgi:FMN phosphatase YigB (HAD superfamily)
MAPPASPAPAALTQALVQAIAFDLDGTLYSVRAHLFRIGWMLAPHHRVLRAWTRAIASMRGARFSDPRQEAIERMADRLERPVREVSDELELVLDRLWTGSLKPSHVLPGIRASLDLIDRRGLPRLVASDHPPHARLEALGLLDGWRGALGAESLGALKPLPDLILESSSRLGVSPDRLLYVGDRDDTDAAAARAAGARFLLVGGNGVSHARLPEVLEDLLKT